MSYPVGAWPNDDYEGNKKLDDFAKSKGYIKRNPFQYEHKETGKFLTDREMQSLMKGDK